MQTSKGFQQFHLNLLLMVMTLTIAATAQDQVRVQSGLLQGAKGLDPAIRVFKGIPYATPPVGDLRWRAPKPLKSWTGVRKADAFGPRCMQAGLFDDMIFRDTMSEDCLYLNVWTPVKSAKDKLPVMVWIHGGGFAAGSSSEPRQDGENLAKKGVIVVSMNYRLGIFGFVSHPELTKESAHNASGNYGLLDQLAALQWVHENIAAFGGDPQNVTIFGESAGSLSVSALMASPLAQGLFQRAIGESGAFFGKPMLSLQEGEAQSVEFLKTLGNLSIAQLRSKSAEEILAIAPKDWHFTMPIVDGYSLPAQVSTIFAEGKQSHIPLLAGWNAEEGKVNVLFFPEKPTARSFTEQARKTFGDKADQFLKLYPADSDTQAYKSAIDFEGDKFMGHDNWKWLDTQSQVGGVSVYRYSFDQVPLAAPDAKAGPFPIKELGARHAGEIEYVFQAFPLLGIAWQDDDKKLSDLMASYWTNFAKTGDPNGPGLPKWPKFSGSSGAQVMHLVGGQSHAAPDGLLERYKFLDANHEWWPK